MERFTLKQMPKARYHHGDLKNAILEASLDLMKTGGLEALTLRAVAKKLGVSHAAQLYHFPTRAVLLGALAEQGFERFATALEAALTPPSSTAPPDDLLLRVGRAYLAFAKENPQHYRLLFGPELAQDAELTPALQAHSNRALAVLHQAAGPHALLAWSVVHGLAQLRIGPYLCATEPDRDALEQQVDHALATFTETLRGSLRRDPSNP